MCSGLTQMRQVSTGGAKNWMTDVPEEMVVYKQEQYDYFVVINFAWSS